MGYRDIRIITVDIYSGYGTFSVAQDAITENHVLLNDDFPGVDVDINWETEDGVLTISRPTVAVEGGGFISSPAFDFNATLTCVLGVPDN